MKKTMFLILFSCFSLLKATFAQSATSTLNVDTNLKTESAAAVPDLGVIDISKMTKVGTKRYFKVKIKNFSSTQAALNVQVKYKINTGAWITLPPVLMNLAPSQTLTTANIPSAGISGLVTGQSYTVQV